MDFLVGSAIFRDELLVSETVNLWKVNPNSFILANLFEVAQKRAVFGEFCLRSRDAVDVKFEKILALCVVHQCKRASLSNVFMFIECFFLTVANTTCQGEQFVLLQCER